MLVGMFLHRRQLPGDKQVSTVMCSAGAVLQANNTLSRAGRTALHVDGCGMSLTTVRGPCRRSQYQVLAQQYSRQSPVNHTFSRHSKRVGLQPSPGYTATSTVCGCFPCQQQRPYQQHVVQARDRVPPAAAAAGGGGGTAGAGSSSNDGGGGRSGPQHVAEASQPEPPRPNLLTALVKALLAAICGLWGWSLLVDALPRPLLDTSSSSVAVIVPTLNEGKGLAEILANLQQLQPPPAEIIVADANSTDDTVKVARRCGVQVVVSKQRGRGAQMNAGAQAATSELLCFVHADSFPPTDLVSVVHREFREPRTVLIGFVPSIEVDGRRLHAMNFQHFTKTYYGVLLLRPLSFARGLRCLFGDQTMCCRAGDFRRVGGYDERWPIFEDAELCISLHMAGPTPAVATLASRSPQPALSANTTSSSSTSVSHTGSSTWLQEWLCPRGRVKQVLDRVNVTSGRRLAAWGDLKATYIHVVMSLCWYLERDPQRLHALYKKIYTDVFR